MIMVLTFIIQQQVLVLVILYCSITQMHGQPHSQGLPSSSPFDVKREDPG